MPKGQYIRNKRKPTEDRFYSKVLFPENKTNCWEWAGSKNPHGYAQLNIDGKIYRAHRFIYEFWFGTIPKKGIIHHKCNNTSCVNPEHLELFNSQIDHLEKTPSFLLGRKHNSYKTHCKYGHPYSGTNLYKRPDGKGRDCKICREEIEKKRIREINGLIYPKKYRKGKTNIERLLN